MIKSAASPEITVRGYKRADGLVGFRNHLLVISTIDLANDVCLGVVGQIPEAVALLTPGGGLSYGRELALLRRLRWRISANPNVGAVLILGAAEGEIVLLQARIKTLLKPVASISILGSRDVVRLVRSCVAVGEKLARGLAREPRQVVPLSALRIGIKSSTTSASSAKLTHPTVGCLTDAVISTGGSVVATEAADLCGAIPSIAARGATPRVKHMLRKELSSTRTLIDQLGQSAPDPTPINKIGGIKNLRHKSLAAAARFGCAEISSVVRYGTALPGRGLHFMTGPSSAAASVIGLTAAGCNLIVYTIGMSAVTPASPLVPLIKVGSPELSRSRDIDLMANLVVPSEGVLRLTAKIASGQRAASERTAHRQIVLPSNLPRL